MLSGGRVSFNDENTNEQESYLSD